MRPRRWQAVTLRPKRSSKGNSRANFYHWVNFLNKAGQVDTTVSADTPLYAVLKKGNKRTYLVYSATAQPRKVTFSDGTVIVVRKAGLSVK